MKKLFLLICMLIILSASVLADTGTITITGTIASCDDSENALDITVNEGGSLSFSSIGVCVISVPSSDPLRLGMQCVKGCDFVSMTPCDQISGQATLTCEETTVPEFSTIGIVAGIIVIGGVAVWFYKKKKTPELKK